MMADLKSSWHSSSVEIAFESGMGGVFVILGDEMPQPPLHKMSEETTGVACPDYERMLCGRNELQPNVFTPSYEFPFDGFIEEYQKSSCVT